MEAVGRERSSGVDADPARILEWRGRTQVAGIPFADVKIDGFPRLPAMGTDVRRRGSLRAVVAQWLLAVGKVQPDDWGTVAPGEADPRLTDRAYLAGQQSAAIRENRRSRAAVGAEAPRVGLHPGDVGPPRREAWIDPRTRAGPVLAVEHSGDEPFRVGRCRHPEFDADAGVDGRRAFVGDARPVEAEAVDGRAVECDRPMLEHSSLLRARRRRDPRWSVSAPPPGADRGRCRRT